jgi:hypothetical protein
MLSALQQAVTRPASFFEQEARDPGLLRPAVVVGLLALVGLLGAIPSFIAITDALPPGAGIFAAIGFVFSSVIGVVIPFITWLVFAVLFLLGTLAFGGEGDFRDLFAATGWGFAPRIIASVVGAVVSFVVLSGTDFSDPQQARQLSQSLATGTLGLLTQGVSVVTYLWSGWVWTHAVAITQELSVRQAGVVVGVVVVLALGLNIGSTLLLT